ncbi:XRE family transcriptional regulator [Pseudomonas sp. v388]|uniref:helix-turn-helix domain-containing protein n=1 Tax=Pseudomonas sp. v388 TaxID=2479849 RepID=UPI000F78EBA4|nr:helix-turn-helix transcriptional regulator [Pseudomonas sp. v388]RRV10730.1 XRE family transcriptional regulator [Pseudomonas sp. v388]
MSDIGSRLRQERKRLGLSQREIGQLGGVAANAQGKYESGERVPKADYLAALASIGVDVLYVLTDRRTSTVAMDNLVSRVARTGGEPAALFVEVQQAVSQLVTTIEQISNSYDSEARQGDSGGRALSMASRE